MDERVVQFRVGVFFLAAFIATGILLVQFGNLPKLVGTYRVKVRFDNAGGITKDTPVRKSGILIGRVHNVELIDDDRKVLVTLNIQSNKTIYQDEEPIVTRDLLGDTAMVFMPKWDKRAPHLPIDTSKIQPGRLSDDPTGLKRALEGPINTVQETGEALTAASKKLGEAAERVEKILNEDAQRDVRDILHDAAKSLKVVQKVLGDEENQSKLADALSKLPKTLDSMNHTFVATDETLRQFTERSGPDRKTAIERMIDTINMTERTLSKFSEGDHPPVDEIADALHDLHQITGKLASIATTVDEGKGSLGKLLNDPELYERLNRIARNVEQLTRELRPIVEDAHVLVDKGARHPGVFIRDAIKPGVGIK